MTFSYIQGGFLNALQSDASDSNDLNLLYQSQVNAFKEDTLPNESYEDHMTSDSSVNQGHDLEDIVYPDYTGLTVDDYGWGINCNLLLNGYKSSLASGTNPFYGSGVVPDLYGSVNQVDEAASAESAIQPDSPQPSFSSIIDYSACASDGEQEITQAIPEQLPIDGDVSPNYEWRLNELEWNEFKEIPRSTCSAFIGEDNTNAILGASQHNLLYVDRLPPMFEDDQKGRIFSSWPRYGYDSNDMAAFKNVVSDNTSGHKLQSTAGALTKAGSIANPTANLNKSFREHAIRGPQSQANRASLLRKPNSNIVGNRAMHYTNTRSLSNWDTMQYNSHIQSVRQPPLFDYNSALADAGTSIQGAFARTNMLNSSTGHWFTVCNHADREVALINENKRSNYFLRKDRNASNVRKDGY
ncbi:uncharacterized protein ATC70_003940 [Mucor velutinosus]|uniref:Uncharacterized protein n=1 Tax=Mucor velutinosus TaxID=708070 RepID=A0AAN7HXY9_9FUNG|nr:hypothetical protein ATC70_003940 [Mucor velutinosus]